MVCDPEQTKPEPKQHGGGVSCTHTNTHTFREVAPAATYVVAFNLCCGTNAGIELSHQVDHKGQHVQVVKLCRRAVLDDQSQGSQAHQPPPRVVLNRKLLTQLRHQRQHIVDLRATHTRTHTVLQMPITTWSWRCWCGFTMSCSPLRSSGRRRLRYHPSTYTSRSRDGYRTCGQGGNHKAHREQKWRAPSCSGAEQGKRAAALTSKLRQLQDTEPGRRSTCAFSPRSLPAVDVASAADAAMSSAVAEASRS